MENTDNLILLYITIYFILNLGIFLLMLWLEDHKIANFQIKGTELVAFVVTFTIGPLILIFGIIPTLLAKLFKYLNSK